VKKFNIGIIGLGRISSKHILSLKSLGSKFNLVSVCEINKKILKNFKFNKNIKKYSKISDMLKEQKLDIVSILTPSGMHLDHIKYTSLYCKNIVVEKPMAMNHAQSKQVIKIIKNNKNNLFVVKQNRFNLAIVKLKEAIDKKRFGKIFLGTVRLRWSRNKDYYNMDKWRKTWKYDGGVLGNQASHHVDLLQWFLGKINKVYSKSKRVFKFKKTDDTVLSIIDFKSGALGLVEATVATRPKDVEGSISILGTKGTVEIGGYAVSKIKVWNFVNKIKSDKNIHKYSRLYKNVYGAGHKQFYENLYLSLLKRKSFSVNALEASKSVILVDKIIAASELNKEIYFNDKNYSKRIGIKN
jgi:hypothetical protein